MALHEIAGSIVINKLSGGLVAC